MGQSAESAESAAELHMDPVPSTLQSAEQKDQLEQVVAWVAGLHKDPAELVAAAVGFSVQRTRLVGWVVSQEQ